MITYREYCKTIKEDWGKTSPIPKEVYADVKWEDNFHWIDLGLPSGTLWADANLYNPDDDHGFWTWDKIMASAYKDYVPTKEHFQELYDFCGWVWDNNKKGMTLQYRGDGDEIFLPAEGYREGSSVRFVGVGGDYLMSTKDDEYSEVFYSLDFAKSGVNIDCYSDCGLDGLSVRLVKKK